MSALRIPVSATLLLASLLIISAFLFNACSISPEQTAQLQKMQEQLTALEEFRKQSKSSVEAVYFEMDDLAEKVRTLEANAKLTPVSAADVEPLLKRIADLEQRVSAMASGAKARGGERVLSNASITEEGIASVKDSVVKASPAVPSVRESRSRSVASRRSERRETSVSYAAPKGFYYRVQVGETLQGVARKHQVTSAQICKANHFPMSVLLYAGQQIYIPTNS